MRTSPQRLLHDINHIIQSNSQDILQEYSFPSQEYSSSSSSHSLPRTREERDEMLKRHSLHMIQDELNQIYDYLDTHDPHDKSTLLSIAELRGVYTGLELLWVWGILPSLQMKHEIETIPKSILIPRVTLVEVFQQIEKTYSLETCRKILPNLDFIQTIFQLCTSQMFRGMMLERNLKRILCAIISILCENRIQSLPTEDSGKIGAAATHGWKTLVEHSQKLLNQIIFDSDISIPNVIVAQNSKFQDIDRVTTIEALRYVSLQGTGAMQRVVAGLLTMILIQPDGLKSTLHTYTSCESQDWDISTRLSQIAKLVTSLPANLPITLLNSCCSHYLRGISCAVEDFEKSPDSSYFFCLSIQLRYLLPTLQKSKESNVMMLACVLILGRLSLLCPDILSKYCFQVWFGPILQIGISTEAKFLITSPVNTFVDNTIVPEDFLFECIELLHIISTAVPFNQNLLDCWTDNGVVEATIDLMIFILLSAPLSELRSYVFTICREMITCGSVEKIVNIIEHIITFGWKNQYHTTSSGRIEIISPQNNRQSPGPFSFDSKLFSNLSLDSGENESDYMNLLSEALRVKQLEIGDEESDYGLTLIQQVMERTRAVSTLLVEIFPVDCDLSRSCCSIPSSLFLRILRGYLLTEEKSISTIPPHICGIALLVMKSHISLELLLRDGYEILLLLGVFLETRSKDQYVRDANYEVIKSRGTQGQRKQPQSLIEEVSDLKASLQSEIENSSELLNRTEEDVDQNEIISTVLALLGSMMEMGSMKREDREEEVLRQTILPALQQIACRDKDSSISEMASDVALMIMVRGNNNSEVRSEEQKPPSSVSEILRDCEINLSDSEPPVRAYGIKKLITTIRTSKEMFSQQDILRIKDILIKMLGDQESFVYLAAVHALSRIIDMNRKLLFPPLLELFGGRNPTPVGSLSLKTRAAIGEVLSLSLRKAGELAPLFVPSVVAECISICRHRAYIPSNEQGIDVNLSSMRITIESSDRLETATDKEIEQVNRTIDNVSQAADTIYLRQSAYSLLSEAMACGGWTAGKYIRDTLDIAVGTLQLEAQKRQEHIVMRRASVFMLKYILEGMKEKMFILPDGGDYLKSIYRILKVACRDNDSVIVFQAERAFYILESLVKDQFVPSEDVPKIRVLN